MLLTLSALSMANAMEAKDGLINGYQPEPEAEVGLHGGAGEAADTSVLL